MIQGTRPPQFAGDMLVPAETLRVLAHALELALPHLPPEVLRELSATLDVGVRFVPEGRLPSTVHRSTVESELRAVWSSLQDDPSR